MTTDELVALALSKLPAKRSLPSKSFVVLTGSEKWETLDPEIIGPFPSYRDAYEWIARLPNASIEADGFLAGHIRLTPVNPALLCQPQASEFAGWAIVNAETAASPQAYAEMCAQLEKPLIPNAETIEAMEAARRGEFTGSFATVDELMAHLHEDD